MTPSDPVTKPLCVFIDNGEVCESPESSYVHDLRLPETHNYTPPAETPRACTPELFPEQQTPEPEANLDLARTVWEYCRYNDDLRHVAKLIAGAAEPAETKAEQISNSGFSGYVRAKAPEPAAPVSPPRTSRQHCHAQTDGDCTWKECPQLKDYQSYCPLAAADDEFYGEEI